MASTPTFNTPVHQTIARHMLVAYLNTGTAEAPVWAPLGKRVEDSSEEYDWSLETKRDIHGASYSTMKTPIITQTFDPWDLSNGDTAQEHIWNIAVRDQNAQAMSAMDLLIAHLYAGTSGSAFAERYSACAVEVTGLGGEGGGNIGMPVSVTYGGTRTVGTVAVSSGTVTFTPKN